MTGKGYKDCLQGRVTFEGAWKSPELKAAFSMRPRSSQLLRMCSQRGLCPPGPKMPPESELQKPDVSALTGFQERSAVLRSPHFLLHTHRLVLCGGKREAFTICPPAALSPGDSYRCLVACLQELGGQLSMGLGTGETPQIQTLGSSTPFRFVPSLSSFLHLLN